MVNGVSFIIPVYNEEDIFINNCIYLLEFIQKLDVPFEIIIGSNGSTDKTNSLGYAFAKENHQIRFFNLPQKGVVGSVFSNAVRMSQYEKLMSLDIDLTIDLSFINHSIELLDEYDLVIGSKKAGKESRFWLRRLGSYTYIWLVRKLLKLEFTDYSIGAKAYQRNAILSHIDEIDTRTGYVLTLIYYLNKSQHPIVQIPVICNDHRNSKYDLFREGLYRFFHLFNLWFRDRCQFPHVG